MEAVIDSVRRIISRWVNTATPLIADANISDDTISVRSTKRFQVNDQVMIRDAVFYETGLRVVEVPDRNTIVLSSGILSQDWTVNQNAVLIKTVDEMFVQGVYFGDPDVIPQYPAVTVFGAEKTSNWLTLDSTSERYELQINVYVLDSAHESGHRFLHRVTDAIQDGLKKNIYPLVGDHETTSLKTDVLTGDFFLKVNDTSIFTEGDRILIEDTYKMQEAFVRSILDDETIAIYQQVFEDYSEDDTTIISPTRFIYNSWPPTINYGKVHKGDLLQASTINWFAEEEELQLMRKQDPQLA